MKTVGKYKLVISTHSDKESAKKLAKAIVEKKLGACVQLIQMDSIYMWEGKTCDEPEILILIKTEESKYSELELYIKSIHTYKNPEIICIDIENGSSDYLSWITSSLKS